MRSLRLARFVLGVLVMVVGCGISGVLLMDAFILVQDGYRLGSVVALLTILAIVYTVSAAIIEINGKDRG